MKASMKLIDLTWTIDSKMPTHPLDIPLSLQPTVTVEKDGVSNHNISCSMHIGTHIDAPGHFILHGKSIIDFPLSAFIGNAVVINATNKSSIGVSLLENIIIEKNDIVLFYTGFDKNFYTPNYFTGHPVITPECARYLIDKQVKMVGIDFPSVDQAPYAIHTLLLGNDILIIENLTNLDQLVTQKNITLYAIPLKIDAHGAPARVFAMI